MAPRIDQDRRDRPPDFPPAGNVIPYETFLAAKARREGCPTPPLPEAATALAADEFREDLRAEINRLPEIRKEKVRKARKRMRQGFYDRPEVLEEIARRLLRADRPPVREEGGER